MPPSLKWPTAILVAFISVVGATVCPALDEFEQPPIEYSKGEPDNAVSRLAAQLAENRVEFAYDPQLGYLPALLKALDIPVDSQMLVFSRTSMQRNRISPRTPRALYFNDEVYVGFCHGGDFIEIAAVDPMLGTVFYTLDQETQEGSPLPTRQTQTCLQCHSATQVDQIPGLLARSVFTGPSGIPILSEGSHRVDHTTPLKDRWGGWYVTGTHGEQPHLGNLIVRDKQAQRPFDNELGHNVMDLSDRFKIADYPTPHSDIVTLMVFEHQIAVHNAITKANFETRRALHYEAGFNEALGKPASNRLDSTTRRIENVGDKLVEALFLLEEPQLTAPITGSSNFTAEFSQRGPRDAHGRSLRDFDLQTRLFKYPCSYLIYTTAFDHLPQEVKTYVTHKMREVLLSDDPQDEFSHISLDDRRAIFEILNETKPELWDN